MDISSLLSPQDASSPDGGSPTRSSVPPYPRRAVSGGRLSVAATSPLAESPVPRSTPRTGALRAQQKPLPSPVVTSRNSSRLSTPISPPLAAGKQKNPPSRQLSATPGMDTLAELASMQHHQQRARANTSGLRNRDLYDKRSLPTSTTYLSKSPVPQALAAARASIDISMGESPLSRETPVPRTFDTKSLSQTELEMMNHLSAALVENTYDVSAHMQLVNLLHSGFIAHISSDPPEDPESYELLTDLRRAREDMEARFPVGERLWADWIADESILAGDIEAKVKLIELCKAAVEEEPFSTKLWQLYAEWMTALFLSLVADELGDVLSDVGLVMNPWSEEEKIVGTELFTWESVLEVWNQARKAVQWRINDGHLIWDRYFEVLTDDLDGAPNQQKIETLLASFNDRLLTPHATWDDTSSRFSTFLTKYITKNNQTAWELKMRDATKRAKTAKDLYSAREVIELKLMRAAEAQDEAAEGVLFTEYLESEIADSAKKQRLDLCIAVFERTLLRFPIYATIWEDYAFFLIERSNSNPEIGSALPVLRRATRHCPWSGNLWSQYLITAEKEKKPFEDLEEIKHSATKNGLLEMGDMEDIVKVNAAWCGFLKRRMFHEEATDEELDVADMGIRSALEAVKQFGETKAGKDYRGDRQYRMDRIYIQFLSQSGLWDSAREAWKTLVAAYSDSYEFWVRYYHWEMVCWSKLTDGSGAAANRNFEQPSQATAVLRGAADSPIIDKIDWPEKILQLYTSHVEDYEDVEELQAAMVLIRNSNKKIAVRRAREAEEAAAAAAVAAAQQVLPATETPEDQVMDDISTTGKRKRSEHEDVESGPKKRTRSNDDLDVMETTVADNSTLKRDREHTTIIVKNLPETVTETRVRQYFRDCGTINSLKLLKSTDSSSPSMTATIEFDSQEDVLSAQTKDLKLFDGNTIHVQVGAGTTLWITNFPPEADETYIRDLFSPFGEIIDIRFPSLKYNTHRRFSYLQFKSSASASSAVASLHNTSSPSSKLKLVVKLSDPSQKQDRSGPTHEGRELYVSNVDWAASESDLKSVFGKYGEVESVRVPKRMDGKSKGMAFIVFADKRHAAAALELNDTKFMSRLLHVEISTPKTGKRTATSILPAPDSAAASPNPDASSPQADGVAAAALNGVDASSAHTTQTPPDKKELQARTLSLMGIPDTLSTARLHALLAPHGVVKKLTLRPDHGGALVEFASAAEAGRAALGMEGYVFKDGSGSSGGANERVVRVGDYADLMGEKEEVRVSRGFGTSGTKGAEKEKKEGSKKEGKKKAGLGFMPQNTLVKRPALQMLATGQKRTGGGRGGLGVKGGGGGLGGKRAGDGAKAVKGEDGDVEDRVNGDGTEKEKEKKKKKEKDAGASTTTQDGSKKPMKTNADFKALFLK